MNDYGSTNVPLDNAQAYSMMSQKFVLFRIHGRVGMQQVEACEHSQGFGLQV
jgi:hypothetical protein